MDVEQVACLLALVGGCEVDELSTLAKFQIPVLTLVERQAWPATSWFVKG